MQKNFKIISFGIILIIIVIGIIIMNYNSDNKYSFKQDGIKYALTLDENKITSFPSKGLYKVQVSCEGADGSWLYDEWKLSLENVTGEVSCDINFNTITKTNLNDYIISLAGSEQGTGQVVRETIDIPDYSNTTFITESAYTSQSIFLSTDSGSTSGTEVSGAYTFADDTWTSVPSIMTSGKYYHFKFNPNENGYYQLCYNLSTGNANNRLYADVNTSSKKFDSSNSLSASTSTEKNGCIELGYVTTSDYIKISQYAYTNISTLSFSIKKVINVQENVNVGIRYEGKNPNNYIWFNNEYWRIIGVFDSASHGQSGKNLVKIIRAEVLDGLVWNKSETNDWQASSLNSLLNGAYYKAENGTNSGYCYGYSATVTANCDYTKKGIQSGYRGMIANVTWYLGGNAGQGQTTKDFYKYERGTTVYDGNSTSTIGHIGLMYPSDYGYSVLSSSCARTTSLLNYGKKSTCAGESWMHGKGFEWTLMPVSLDNNHVFHLVFGGNLYYTYVYKGYVFRPVLYLDESVYKIDGNGSLDSPYIIGM